MNATRSSFPISRWSPLALGLALLACGGESAPPEVVARSTYGDTQSADLEQFILSLPDGRRQPAAGQKLVDWRREMLEEMLVTRRLAEEADEAKLLAGDEGQLYVKSRWEPLLNAHVSEHRIAEKVQLTDDDLRRFYDQHPEEFGHGPQIRVRHIFKRTTRNASPEERETARREIDTLLGQLQEGASFTELARDHSDSETAPLDGLIGRLQRGALGPQLDDVVWALDEGEISEVVATPTGFHVFRVDNHLQPFQMEFAEARTRLRRRLEREATEATLATYTEELLEASGAHYAPDGLEGEDDELLFALGEIELTRGDFLQRVFALGFEQQRSLSLREQLEQAATQELYRWQAERLELAAEPELVAQREQLERTAKIELAYRDRRRAHLEGLPDSILRDYFEENKKRFRSPQQLRLRLLVRRFEDEGQEWFELYEELERLAAAIRAGELDFAEQAKLKSQDLSAANGGDTGWIRPGAIGDFAGPRASKATLALKLNEVSEPILMESYNDNQLLYAREGYLLVRVEQLRPAATPPFEEIRDKVAEHFVANGSEELQQQIRREVLEEIGATIFQGHL